MTVVFLDFDGVLNSAKYDEERDKTRNTNIDESRLPYLKRIVEKTGAKIVLTTSWREHWNKNEADCDDVGVWLNALFEKYGLKIYDKTPRLHFGAGRKAEVFSWLEYPPEKIENYVIIDDYGFAWEELGDKLVKTSPYIGRGLEEEHVRKAIEILGTL